MYVMSYSLVAINRRLQVIKAKMLEFRVNKVLGYGSFATVFQAISRRGADVGQSYALRHFDRNDDEALNALFVSITFSLV